MNKYYNEKIELNSLYGRMVEIRLLEYPWSVSVSVFSDNYQRFEFRRFQRRSDAEDYAKSRSEEMEFGEMNKLEIAHCGVVVLAYVNNGGRHIKRYGGNINGKKL